MVEIINKTYNMAENFLQSVYELPLQWYSKHWIEMVIIDIMLIVSLIGWCNA